MKKYFLLIMVLLSLNIGAQVNYKTELLQHKANFRSLVAQQRQYFADKKANGEWTRYDKKAQKQFERWAYLWKDRIDANGQFPENIPDLSKQDFINLLDSRNNTKNHNNLATAQWTQVGPVNRPNINGYDAYPGMGRVNVVAVSPANNNIMYVGTAGGGVWKTTNGGSSWTPMSDNLATLGVADIIINPSNANIIYIATGDPDGFQYPSIGVFKSTDAGATWNPTGLTFSLSNGEFIRDLAFAPGNPSKIFALTNYRIKYSTNSGASWSNATVSDAPNGARYQSIIFDPNDNNKVIASDYFGNIYYSTNGGSNFSKNTGLPGGGGAWGNHLKLAATPNDNDYCYGMYNDGHFAKFKYNMTNSSSDRVRYTAISGYEPQYGYNICLAVSPTDQNKIMVGGVKGYQSTNNGQSFTVKMNPYNDPPGVGFYMHPDFHYFGFLSDGATVITGHDGGLHKGTFGSSNWTDLSNGLVITQSYNIALTQASNGDDFMMANQDNDGFSKVQKNGSRQWVSCAAGDGTCTAINYNNPNIRYLGGASGALYKSTDAYASSAYSASVLASGSASAAFVSPLSLHPTNPAILYAGYGDVRKSSNSGGSFTSLNSGLTKTSFLDITTNNSSVNIYAIGDNGAKHSNNDGSSWSSISSPVSGQDINSFAAKPNSNIVYATVSGYQSGAKVFKSTNGGSSWTNISNGLPNIVMKKVLLKTDLNNETLILATEAGVYWKDNTHTSWQKLGIGLPNVIVTDLKINYTDQDLYIGSFGRGMWKVHVANIGAVSFNEDEKPVVYPNPVVNNLVNVKIQDVLLDNNQPVDYKVFNVVGGIISEGSLQQNNNQIRLNNPAKGIYMIRISNGQKSMLKKLIVK